MRTCSGRALALLFLALALPLGLLLVQLVPLGQVADEPAHVLRADSLLHGEWIGRRVMQHSPDGGFHPSEGVDADRALLAVIVALPRPLDTVPMQINPAALARSTTVPFGQVQFSEIGTIASYFPVFYLPAAAVLSVAKTVHLSAREGFLAARFANLLVALSMGAASLILARRGAALLFAMLLSPTSMALMASVNQDGLLIAASALAASLTTRIGADAAPWRQPAYLGAAVLVGCLCLAKPPYMPMTALLLLPLGSPQRRWLPGWPAVRLATLGAILLPVLFWTWANVHYAAAPVFRVPEEAGPLWTGPRPAIFAGTNMAAQLQVLLVKPWRLVWLPMHSFLDHPAILRQMVDVLGWLNLLLPDWLVGLWATALILTLLEALASRRHPGQAVEAVSETMLLGIAVLTTVLLIYLSQYLSFTPVGWNWISGPQGRYLIPLLPILCLAIVPSQGGVIAPRRWTVMLGIVAGLASLSTVPVCVVDFYYVGTG